MNPVDSCGWIEYFIGGRNADEYAVPLSDKENLLVPTICIYEVFKHVVRYGDEAKGLGVVAVMMQGQVVDIDAKIAVNAARIAIDFGLAMADSVILATARQYSATIWTQHKHFKNHDGVNYLEKLN